MRTLAIIAACAAWMCVDCRAEASPATDAIKACAPYRDLIAEAAEAASVPVALLTALSFKESTCNPNAVNGISGAIGLTQLLPSGAGAGYSKKELLDPWINASVGAKYLSKWHSRCRTWRGAVEIYGARQRCSVRSKQGASIIMLWKAIEKLESPRT